MFVFSTVSIYMLCSGTCVRAWKQLVHVLRMCVVCAILYTNMFIHCYACYFTCFYYYPRVCPYFPMVMCVILCDVSYFVTITVTPMKFALSCVLFHALPCRRNGAVYYQKKLKEQQCIVFSVIYIYIYIVIRGIIDKTTQHYSMILLYI